MRGRGGLVTSFAVVLAAQPVTARDPPEVLSPSSAWVVDYAEDSCALRRQFGGPDRAVVLEMRQFAPGTMNFQYKLLSDHYGLNRRSRAAGLTVRYMPDDEWSEAGSAFNLAQTDEWRGVTFDHSLFDQQITEFYRTHDEATGAERQAFFASLDNAAREQAISAIEVRNAFARDVVLQTGPLFAPMNAMRDCLDELLLHWGIDAEAHQTLRQRAAPIDQASWARRVQQVYPLAGNGEQAVLRVRLAVSAEGRVTGCHTQIRMGEEAFERAACDILLDHARFSPALDAQGNAITNFHVLAIAYSLG